MDPEISILLPVYNAEQTLETCLRSLLRQRMDAWECVRVDDGSGDRHLELTAGIASHNTHIRVF